MHEADADDNGRASHDNLADKRASPGRVARRVGAILRHAMFNGRQSKGFSRYLSRWVDARRRMACYLPCPLNR
jgi:hypothetical protein